MRVMRKRDGKMPYRWYLDIESIEERERMREHFASGLGGVKLFWMFLMSGAFGVLVETVFWFIRTGQIESRATFVWAPLNMVYGAGGVLMTVILYHARKYPFPVIFLVGMAVGCFVEYTCSLVQEVVFSSVSWHYSDMMDIHGRTNMKYAFFWGILALFWLGVMYPTMSALLLKIPRRTGRLLTVVLLIYMTINIGMTFFAVRRWEARQRHTEPVFTIHQLMDAWFPDDFMEHLFPNLRFVRAENKTSLPE
ncbi:MAG: putative ABC transporter permease [Oscillospiraceae bacterium]|nr:putative ABC transporter permease [Oscillospiraceae bacterium]